MELVFVETKFPDVNLINDLIYVFQKKEKLFIEDRRTRRQEELRQSTELARQCVDNWNKL